MRLKLAALSQFVASIGVAIKAFFSVPECEVCKVREYFGDKFQAELEDRIGWLENQLEIERAEKDLLQAKLFKLLRLEDKPQSAQSSGEPTKVSGGIQSPLKQRAAAEVESRRKYWGEKLKKIEASKNANQ